MTSRTRGSAIAGVAGKGAIHGDLQHRLAVFDGLLISRWDPELFLKMRHGHLTAANCTCSVWENCQETLRNISRWNIWFRDYADKIFKARTVADVRRAQREDKTAIILGFQNVSAFEDQVGYVELFKELGIGIVQLAYNTQNLVGSGCYESHDSGLSDFGHDIVAEMNRVGIACDLSHVGIATAHDVILSSGKPVCFSHCLPAGLKQHPRNRTDEELRLVADHGGIIGVTLFSPFLPKGAGSAVDDYIGAIEYVIRVAGEDSVGIGTDFTQGHSKAFFDWITHDKGNGRQLTDFGEVATPRGFSGVEEYPRLLEAMERSGWTEMRIAKVAGENWLRFLEQVWGG